MKVFKHIVVGLGLLALVGCNNVVREENGIHDLEVTKRKGLNTMIIYTRDISPKRDSLSVLRHFWGNSYYFEDYNCDGSIDMIYILGLKKFIYKVDPITKKKNDAYERLFDKADELLSKYKIELGIGVSKEESLLLEYLD